ncbi:methionyl-tRNA formyltransferase [Roseivirga seohaensis]|uniref:methionyl-tRNA formyltransferase n=1 Tax=Roseivirga seohaensis TaxID=1914963 RepID=UPI003BAB04B8
MNKEGIIFLGSGEEILLALQKMNNLGLAKGFGAHESNKSSARESIDFCKRNSIPVINSLESAIALNPRFVFMLSYPLLIKKEHLDQCLFVNMHGALVPRYRGIHGGTWAMVNGESQQGYTIHKVDEGIDSGPIFFQGKVTVGVSENINQVRQKIRNHFNCNIERVLREVYDGIAKATEQKEEQAIYVCRRTKKDGLIDWFKTSWEIHNLIRALTPPYTQGAYSHYKDKELVLTKSVYKKLPEYIGVPGQVVANFKEQGVLIKTGDSALLVTEVCLEGKVVHPSTLFNTVGYRLG